MEQRVQRKLTTLISFCVFGINPMYIRGAVATQSGLTANTAAVGAQFVRMIIVVDSQPNGTVFAITDLLNTADPASQLNLNNRDRFNIICDKEWAFDPYLVDATATQSFASASKQIYTIKKFKKLNIETIFNAGNAGTIADMNSGALYMVWIGSIASGLTDSLAQVSTRVRFQDP